MQNHVQDNLIWASSLPEHGWKRDKTYDTRSELVIN